MDLHGFLRKHRDQVTVASRSATAIPPGIHLWGCLDLNSKLFATLTLSKLRLSHEPEPTWYEGHECNEDQAAGHARMTEQDEQSAASPIHEGHSC